MARQFVFLLRMDISALFYNWYITVPLIALVLVAALLQRHSFRSIAVRSPLLLLPLAIPLLIILCHVVRDMQPRGDVSWLSPVTGTLLIVYVVVSTFVVFCLAGFRWAALTVVLFESWFTFICAWTALLS